MNTMMRYKGKNYFHQGKSLDNSLKKAFGGLNNGLDFLDTRWVDSRVVETCLTNGGEDEQNH